MTGGGCRSHDRDPEAETDRSRQVVSSYVAAFSAGDPDRVCALFAPEAELQAHSDVTLGPNVAEGIAGRGSKDVSGEVKPESSAGRVTTGAAPGTSS